MRRFLHRKAAAFAPPSKHLICHELADGPSPPPFRGRFHIAVTHCALPAIQLALVRPPSSSTVACALSHRPVLLAHGSPVRDSGGPVDWYARAPVAKAGCGACLPPLSCVFAGASLRVFCQSPHTNEMGFSITHHAKAGEEADRRHLNLTNLLA